jgi:hypothetical protein
MFDPESVWTASITWRLRSQAVWILDGHCNCLIVLLWELKRNRMSSTKIILASQARSINLHKNLTTKITKCCANIYFNWQCLIKTLIPNYTNYKDPILFPCYENHSKEGTLRLKCGDIRAEIRFRLSVKRTSPFKSAGASVQSTTGSRGVRISGSNAGYTMFRGSVKSTGYPLHSPVFPSLPLPCITVCHHISTGLYKQSA